MPASYILAVLKEAIVSDGHKADSVGHQYQSLVVATFQIEVLVVSAM